VVVSRNGRIGVLGTLSTIRSGAYPEAVGARDPSARLTGLACPLLVPLAEEGWTEGEVPEIVIGHYLATLLAQDDEIDTLVLGCTHYPLLAGVIGQTAARIAGRAITLVDSAEAMADAARILVESRENEAVRHVGELAIYVTDATRMEELAERFLGEPAHRFEVVDL
jgi:glutamate racemase